jgi:hypothetical protein
LPFTSPSNERGRSYRKYQSLESPAKNLEHDPEQREPAVLLDYFRFTLVSGHRQSWARGPKSAITYRNMGVAVGIFATPEKFSALPISVLEL